MLVKTKKMKVVKEGNYFKYQTDNLLFLTTDLSNFRTLSQKKIEISESKKQHSQEELKELSKKAFKKKIICRTLPEKPKNRYFVDNEGNIMFENNGCLVQNSSIGGEVFQINKQMMDFAINLRLPLVMTEYENKIVYTVGNRILCVETIDGRVYKKVTIDLKHAEEVVKVRREELIVQSKLYEKIRLISTDEGMVSIGLENIFNTTHKKREKIKKLDTKSDMVFSIDIDSAIVRQVKEEFLLIKETLKVYTINDKFISQKSKNLSYV